MKRKPFRARLWFVLATRVAGRGLVPAAFSAEPSGFGPPDSWQLRPSDPYGIRDISSPAVGDIGFQWGDAGIGGAVGFGIAVWLRAMCAALLQRNRQRGESGRAALA